MWKCETITMLLLMASFLLFGCEKDSTGLAPDQGILNVYVTDAPAVCDSVNITFSQVSAHIDSEWVTVTGEPVTVDLLKWTNGNKLLIGSAEVPAGKYTQIRIIIDEAEVGVDGKVFPLDVPSGAKTGLKFGPQFTIEEGSSYDLICDFDASRSIVVTGSKKDPKGYKLKPHIRVVSKAVTGSISGTVSPADHIPWAYAIQDIDTITSSRVDTSGYFRLSFLPEGIYTVSVVDTNGLSNDQANVLVIAGDDNDLGSMDLN
jgi:hypothetical protein